MCQDSNLWKKILVNCGTGTDIATQTSQTFTNNKLGSFKLYHNILISLVLNSCTFIVQYNFLLYVLSKIVSKRD